MREGLTFTSSQKKGFIVLLAMISAITATITGWEFLSKEDPLSLEFSDPLFTSPVYTRDSVTKLDINLADSAAWVSLKGIGPVLAKRIINYRRSLGGFTDVNQISRVYGLSGETFDRLVPLLMVNEITAPSSVAGNKHNGKKQIAASTSAIPEYPLLDLNTATAGELARLPGIGETLSNRIVSYREKLNGYQNINDLGAVYNLPKETLNYIRPYLYINEKTLSDLRKSRPARREAGNNGLIASAGPEGEEFRTGAFNGLSRGETSDPSGNTDSPAEAKKITSLNLNKADSAELITLPGIGSVLAGRIVKFRNLIGHFRSLDQLKSVYGMSDENYGRMLPYLYVSPSDTSPLQDLNTVNARRLTLYPGISKAFANNLIKYRRKQGRFDSWDEVRKIEGMEPEILETLKAYFKI